MTDDDVALFADFMTGMLRIKPEDRKTALDLIKHPWLRPTFGRWLEKTEKNGVGSSGASKKA